MNPDNQTPREPTEPAPQPTGFVSPPVGPTQSAASSSQATGAPMPAAHPYLKPKKSKKKLLLIIVGSVIALLAAIFIFVIGATGEQVKINEQFISYLQTNKVNEAYALTAESFREATPRTAFDDFAAQEYLYLPKSKPSVVSREISSSGGVTTTTIISNIAAGNGATDYHATTRLIKENGKWVILNIDIKSGLASNPSSSYPPSKASTEDGL